MSFCPNCGSYLSPGTNVCSCGTTFSDRPQPEKKVESKLEKYQKEIKRNVDEWCRQGRKLMGDGEYLKAIEYFDNISRIS